MKHLPKHLRPRWRYLAVRLRGDPDADVARDDFQRACWFAAQNLVGDVGSAATDLRVLDFAFEAGSGHAVVRTRRGEVTKARAVLASVDAVGDDELGIRVAGVGGTVRSCREKFLGSIGA